MTLNLSEVLDFLPEVLECFFEAEDVAEISVNSDGSAFLEESGNRRQVLPAGSVLRGHLEALCRRVAHASNSEINDAHPILHASLPDGSRICAVYPPVVPAPLISIRRIRKAAFSWSHLVMNGMLTNDQFLQLASLVAQRKNILISGGTGTGKTTLLNTLLPMVPIDVRLCLIEKPREIFSSHPNVVALEATDDITVKTLLETALRLYPDRIILGEIRGDEAADLLLALNTGHAGSFATIHANSAAHALHRLAILAMSASQRPYELVLRDISTVIHAVVHIDMTVDRSRKIQEIVSIQGFADGNILTTSVT